SAEVQTEENKVSLDVNKKRTVKTPAQVMALENFYKEHRFPSDEMKAQLAAQIRLTEKQISSWFCHRRLKDKRRDESYANGRQDHSSGVIQDRGSGLRQDSCGSIKQGDYRNVDPREVESRRIYGHDFPVADLTYERRSHQNPYNAHMEDTSSESSSSLHDQRFSESRDPYDMQISANLTQNGAITQIKPRIVKSMGYKPSGYLKVKGEMENPAVTAVKRQLGSHYQEDGPLLGIEFDPLPPGAFEFRSSNLVNEPIYVGDPRQEHSPDISGVIKQPNLNIINEVHNPKMSSQASYMEDANLNTEHGSDRQDRKSHHQLKYKSSFLCSNPFPGQNSSINVYESSAGKTAVSDCKWSRMSFKPAVERMGSDSFSNQPGPYGSKIANEQEKPWLHDDDNHTYKAPKNENLSKTSDLIHGCSESLGTERGPSARMGKLEKLGGEWKPKREYPVRENIDPTNELKVAKRVKVEFPQQNFVANASHSRSLLLTNPTKGSVYYIRQITIHLVILCPFISQSTDQPLPVNPQLINFALQSPSTASSFFSVSSSDP
ncbi:Homeobox domain - like 10, partial [Theobroma cacao]